MKNKLLTKDHHCRQKTDDRVSMRHSMYRAAFSYCVQQNLQVHDKACGIVLQSPPWRYKMERNSNQYDSFIQTGGMKKIFIHIEIYWGQNKKNKNQRNETPKNSVLRHLPLETLKEGLVNLYVLKCFCREQAVPWFAIGSGFVNC